MHPPSNPPPFPDPNAENERAWRDTVATVGSLLVVCVVMLLALYNLSDSPPGPLSATDNLIATLAYLAAFVVPLLLLGLFANLIVLVWCWPRRNGAGEPVYRAAAVLHRRRRVAYLLVIAALAVVAGLQLLRYWNVASAPLP